MSIISIAFRIVMMHESSAAITYSNTLKSWIFLSISVNVLITILISYRLFIVRRQNANVLSKEDLSLYYGIIAILVESALPLTIAGIAFACLSSPYADSGGAIVARNIALLLWFSLSVSVASLHRALVRLLTDANPQALCPQMIIFRVTIGRSWHVNPFLAGPASPLGHGEASTRLEFNRMSVRNSSKGDISATSISAYPP
jgi:hypothetical protein